MSPPIGKSQISQLWCSLICVTHSKATKKKAEAEPEKMPTKAQMKIHLERKRKFFFRFIGGVFCHFDEGEISLIALVM